MKTNKSAGPDGIQAWIFHDFSHIVAAPLASIFNASIQQGIMPACWKIAHTVPIPKINPPGKIESDLRPISLTPIASKVLEHFSCTWMYEAIKDKIDPNQFGGVKCSSTTMALLTIINYIAQATDSGGNHVRMLLCDFSKAFDLVNHNIVLEKLRVMGVPACLLKWSANFLFERKQQVKIGKQLSGIVKLNAGCPQGTLFGPLAFISHINDLQVPPPVHTVKYVDDTSFLASSNDPEDLTMQRTADTLHNWCQTNDMRLNTKKTKEMIFNFTKKSHEFQPLVVDNDVIEQADSTNILGLVLSNDLTWNNHVDFMVKKANKRLFLLTLLKRADVSIEDMVTIFTSIIRPVLEYACVVWHSSLPEYLHNDIEGVQKRALIIICGLNSYKRNLEISELTTLRDRRQKLCCQFFQDMKNSDHKLSYMLPQESTTNYDLRHLNTLAVPFCKTNRYMNSFLPWALRNFQ